MKRSSSVSRQAAQQLNIPAPMVSTHSLRAGGAMAMWAAGYSVEEIQRRGRWVSQCFRIYIWEGREERSLKRGRVSYAQSSKPRCPCLQLCSRKRTETWESSCNTSAYAYKFLLAETAGRCFKRPAAVPLGSFGSSAVLKLAQGKQHSLGRGAQRGVWQAPDAG